MKKAETAGWDLGALIAAGTVALAVFLGFVSLAVRLKDVQVTNAAQYGYDKDRQSVRRVQTDGVRGRILDRHGNPLADNRRAVQIVCCPEQFRRPRELDTIEAIEAVGARVAETIGRPFPLTRRAVSNHVHTVRAMDLPVWRDIGERELALFAVHAQEFPGFELEESSERVYPNGRLAAHLLGYVGRDRGEAEAGDEKFNFVTRELTGRAGLEYYYNSFLRGVSGERRILVDACGYAMREWTVEEAQRGLDLVTTIDTNVQAAVERELKGEKGACAVIDPRNGEVLALASAPGFDPNDFVPVFRSDLYRRYAEDPAKPLLNRACGGVYAPGSTFKPITALAGLSVGFPATREHECIGTYSLLHMKFHCAARWGHGPLDMRHALMKSCNPYFFDLGIDVGTNAIVRAARTFGLGEKTGIDFVSDMAGAVPDGEWKMRKFHEKWYLGDLAQMSIGQGMLLVSPLQMARVAGAIGTGWLVTPHLKLDLPVSRQMLPYSRAQLDVVRDGMRMVVNGDGRDKGTGWRAGEPLRDLGVTACGKTGTAEVGLGATRRKNTWFIAYAPAEKPTVALAMVVENGDSGGGTTAPRAGNVLKAYFESCAAAPRPSTP